MRPNRQMASLGMVILVGWLNLPAAGEDWPHWRGPARNGVVAEDSGWERQGWPPREVWRKQVGEGASSPVVAEGRVYVLGWRNQQDQVTCLDAASGAELWKASYDCPRYGRRATGDEGLYSGPSSTPELDVGNGWLFTLSTDGDLQCWDVARAGRRVWGCNLYERYGAARRPRVGRSGQRDYGYTSSPLALGDALIVEVGAEAGNLIAFDKSTGRELWKSAASNPAGHSGGPVPITVEGIPCVAVHHFDGLLVTRTEPGHEGQTVAQLPWQTEFANNIATPAVHENSVVLTSGYNHHKIARLRVSLEGATKVWERDLASKVCSPLIHRGHVYWAWQELYCLELETGQTKWRGGRLGDPGSCLVTADDRLIVWASRGDLFLVETATRAPREYRVLATQERICRSDAWPHVVLSGGRLFCKDRNGTLVCLEVVGRPR
jgi:outer membrane protein assembly factor BamB